jgi:hypothetical protein
MSVPKLLVQALPVQAGASFPPQPLALPADAHTLLLLVSQPPTTNVVRMTVTGQTTGQVYWNGLVSALDPAVVQLVTGADAGVTVTATNASPSGSAFYSVLASADPMLNPAERLLGVFTVPTSGLTTTVTVQPNEHGVRFLTTAASVAVAMTGATSGFAYTTAVTGALTANQIFQQATDPLVDNSLTLAFTNGGAQSAAVYAVALPFTPTIGVTNTINTNISGTVSVQGVAGGTTIGVAGTVSIGNTPAVSISGTPNVAITSGTVNVGNTPNINISSQSVNLAAELPGALLATGSITNGAHSNDNLTLTTQYNALDILVHLGNNTGSVTVVAKGTTTNELYCNLTKRSNAVFSGDCWLHVPVDPSADATVNVQITNLMGVTVNYAIIGQQQPFASVYPAVSLADMATGSTNPANVAVTGLALLDAASPTSTQPSPQRNVNASTVPYANVPAVGLTADNGASQDRLKSDGAQRLLISAGPPQGTDVVATGVQVHAANVVTLPAVAGKTNYVTGIEITGTGANAASNITAVLSGISVGLNFNIEVPSGITVPLTPIIVEFSRPIPAFGVNVAITLTVPDFGVNGTCAANIHGFYV